MSHHFQYEHEHQIVPFDQCREEEDELRVATQPSFDAVAAPPPTTPPGFARNQAAQNAAQFVHNPDAYQYPVPNQPVQSKPAQNFTAYCDPMHNRPGQHQFAQSQPEQVNLVPWHPTPNYLVTPADIADWLHIPDVLPQDLQYIHEEGRVKVPAQKRACAEQLARSDKFLEWLRSPASSQLLVHTNDSEFAHISGLSLFCESLARVLESRPDRFIPLVFFCGLHAEPPSATGTQGLPSPWLSIGAHGMIRSFIHQLVARYYLGRPVWFPMTPLLRHAVENNDLGALYEIFSLLVRELPSSITVCCLVDGATYYERDEFVENMQRMMPSLLQLAELDTMRGRPKVLLTSPMSTSQVRDWVAEDSILSMTELGRPAQVSDEGGLERMLASALG